MFQNNVSKTTFKYRLNSRENSVHLLEATKKFKLLNECLT